MGFEAANDDSDIRISLQKWGIQYEGTEQFQVLSQKCKIQNGKYSSVWQNLKIYQYLNNTLTMHPTLSIQEETSSQGNVTMETQKTNTSILGPDT